METLAAIIFVLMYMLIVSEKVHRTIVAMMGAIIMIIAGIMPVDTALHHIDFNTLGLLIGMMILVSVTAKTGLFDYVAIKTAKAAKTEKTETAAKTEKTEKAEKSAMEPAKTENAAAAAEAKADAGQNDTK